MRTDLALNSRLFVLGAVVVVLLGAEPALGGSCVCAPPGEASVASCLPDGCADEPAPADSPCCPHGCDLDCLMPCCSGIALAHVRPSVPSHEFGSTPFVEPEDASPPSGASFSIFRPPRA